MYDLELVDNGLDYLCISVKGFIPLWEECILLLGLSYKEYNYPLEGILRDWMRLDVTSAHNKSKEIRSRVKSLLPCTMTSKELQSIILECIKEI